MDPKQEKKDELGEAIASTEPKTPAADPAAPAQPAPAAAPSTSEGVEDLALREAQAAADREDQGTTEPAAPAAAAAAPASAPASAAAPAAAAPAAAAPASTPAAAPGTKAAEKMVPVSALAKERAARQAAEGRANFEAGKAAALLAVAKAGGQAAQAAEPELTPEEELQQIKARRIALAKDFDAGKITDEERETQRIELEDRAEEIRASLRQRVDPSRPDELLVQERTTQIEAQHPVVKNLTDRQIKGLVQLAYEELARDGRPVVGMGPRQDLALRERVAIIATRLYGGQPAAASASPAPGSTTQPAPLSPAAQARAAKLEQAATHPPDVSQLGSAGAGTGVTEDQLMARINAASTEEEVAAILAGAPQKVKQILGEMP